MQDSRLPIELCDMIIDLIPESVPWWETYRYWNTKPRDLLKYTCICYAWLPRARRILYHNVVFTRAAQVSLFVRSISENPLLANMVYGLVIEPKQRETYIPFVDATLIRSLPRLKGLYLDFGDEETWVYPPRYYSLVAKFPITELAIRYPTGKSMWIERFMLIWSLRHLRVLCLDMELFPDFIDADMLRLNSRVRRPTACAELTTLVLHNVQYLYLLPKIAFGTSVQRLSLLGVMGEKPPVTPPEDTLLAHIGLFSSLQELYISIHLTRKLGVKDGHVVASHIVPVLTHLPPQDTLRTILIHIWEADGVGREDFLLELSSEKVDELLTKFRNLRSLHFSLPEPPHSVYDAGRWNDLLFDHLPKLKGAIEISVTIDRDDSEDGRWSGWMDGPYLDLDAQWESISWLEDDLDPAGSEQIASGPGLASEAALEVKHALFLVT